RVQSTLDHALWLHRPARADRWLLMDLQSRAVSQGRGLYAGSVWSEDGALLASLAQETLYRAGRV
ncbi:MAG: thioesterase family protein, partial [Frankiales bacterium]|nr:thioesterase family protein [Frankiales bacterium]